MGAALWECEHCETLVRFRSEELMIDADEEGRVECPYCHGMTKPSPYPPGSPDQLGE